MASNTESTSITHHGHADELLQELEILREELCDVVMIACSNGQKVSGNRIILSACSKYFRALFTGPMLEASQSEVRLGEVHGDFLLPLVQFCYTGKIDIHGDTVSELLQTASRLQLNGAISECCKFIENRLDVSNCLGVFVLAEQLCLNSLKLVAEELICKHFQLVCQGEEFFDVDVKVLCKFIGSDNIIMPSEELVFHSVMSWVEHDSENRKKCIPELLALVRLNLLSPSFLTQHVWYICVNHSCHYLLKEAIRCQNSGDKTLMRPRKLMQTNLLVLSSQNCFNEEGINIEKFWALHSTEPPIYFGQISKRLFFSAAILNDELIIMGGCTDFTEVRPSVESFDLYSKTFTQLNPMLTPRYSFGVAVLKGLLYAVGGRDSRQRLNSVERYDPVDKQWSSVAPMSVARNLLGVAVLDGRLYAVGGFDGSNYHNSTECYDPYTNRWTQRANLNEKRAQFGLAASDRFLYAVGGLSGDDKLSSVERYDLRTNQWTQMCSLNNPRYSVNCVLFGDVLMAIGGVQNNDGTNTVETYDQDSNTWLESNILAQSGKYIRAVLLLT